ncbi:MAG: thiamine-phosphate pyrophosphorylase [Psychromonas sp.]|jgi:thiamine-phosphate pyrophosphorylase
MNIPRLQYITHPNEDFSDLSWMDRLSKNGVSWVQLRIKEEDLERFHPNLHYKSTFIEVAELMQTKAESLGMTLIINDHPEVCRFANASGVHLGLKDKVEESEIEEFKVFGCTANSIEDVLSYGYKNINYFGVGPFKKTSTKVNTKQVLSIEGYTSFMLKMKENKIETPVFAIGGIELDDIPAIMKTGVYGIAVSGLIHSAGHDGSLIKKCVQLIEENSYEFSK